MIRWIRRLLGIEEKAHIAVPPDAIWGRQQLQGDLFAAGASICESGELAGPAPDGSPRVILQCGMESGLGKVLAVLESWEVPAECVEWEPSSSPHFSDLEWAILTNGLERLNDGRSLRRPKW